MSAPDKHRVCYPNLCRVCQPLTSYYRDGMIVMMNKLHNVPPYLQRIFRGLGNYSLHLWLHLSYETIQILQKSQAYLKDICHRNHCRLHTLVNRLRNHHCSGDSCSESLNVHYKRDNYNINHPMYKTGHRHLVIQSILRKRFLHPIHIRLAMKHYHLSNNRIRLHLLHPKLPHQPLKHQDQYRP